MLVMIDLDNTLGNRTAAVQAWAHEFSGDWVLPPEAVQRILDADNDGYSSRADVFAAIKQRYRMHSSVDELVAAYQTRVVALAAPTEGAFQALTDLRALGHSLAIVTNGSSKQQHAKIDMIGFRNMVDVVIVSGDIDIKKPDARIFQAAADATSESLEGSWMVGDSALHDIVGAARFGAKTAWLHRDRAWTETSCTPTVMIDDLTQLVAAIHEHG